MDYSPALIIVRDFLDTVWGSDIPTDETLLAALDRLVGAYHDTPDGGITDPELDAPRQDGAALYREVSRRFPDYGLYPVADPTKSIDDAVMMGDAIDDLADITLDLREVIWLADHAGIDDAHFNLRHQFFHWGQHARELSIYLSGRLWD